MEEPSVLDYVLARLMPWRGPVPEIPRTPGKGTGPEEDVEADKTGVEAPGLRVRGQDIFAPEAQFETAELEGAATHPVSGVNRFPFRSAAALGLALLAQMTLEPGQERGWVTGAILYGLAILLALWSYWRGELQLADPTPEDLAHDSLKIHLNRFVIGLAAGLLAFLLFGGNRFTPFNTIIWLLSIAAVGAAFWQPGQVSENLQKKLSGIRNRSTWQITVHRRHLSIVLVAGVVLFFRLYRLNSVPPEMVSDQAEKLLDIWDVLHGETRIFFPRNTGREGLQMYMTAGIIQLFDTGYSFLSLKIGTVLAGILTLPYIYLTGKEVANRRVGLLAMFLAGIAYWPNVISRVGLRFPLYPLFVAPVLYYVLRGLRLQSRNHFILAGIFLGIGLHGYTPIRILPFLIVLIVAIFLGHHAGRRLRQQTVWMLVVLALISAMVFLPLMRYAIQNPEPFAFRSFSRLGTVERPLPGPVWEIFLGNLWNALTMFGWDNGEIWVTSVTHRPALDVVSAALFYLGCALLLFRYVRQRSWLDLTLLVSVPVLLLPSVLSLAFPAENPSLNRMAGAIIPVFIIAALPLDGILQKLEEWAGRSPTRIIVWSFTAMLVLIAATQNYRLVFVEYQDTYLRSAWNTSEMGAVIRSFSTSLGSDETAYVVAFPHWVDTRLVGMNGGYPLRDFAIWPEQISETTINPGAKLFLLKTDDEEGMQTLNLVYPEGVFTEYDSQVPGHNFYMYFVPPSDR